MSVTVVAIDNSGSTSGSAKYWDLVLRVAESHENALPVLWNSQPSETTWAVVKKNATARLGTGGTAPSHLVEMLLKKKTTDLVLITDGQIDNGEVRNCDRLLANYAFKKVVVYLITAAPDLSVMAPFTRNTEFEVFINEENFSKGSSNQVLDLAKYKNDPLGFLSDAESIATTILVQNLGLMNEALRNELLSLQKSMLAAYVRTDSNEPMSDEVMKMLGEGKTDEAIQQLKAIAETYFNNSDVPKQIEQAIAGMVRSCTSPGQYHTSLLNTSRGQRAGYVDDASINNVPELPAEAIEASNTQGYQCPVYMDVDYPVLLLCLNEGQPLLVGLEKEVVEDVTTCPLNALRYKELVERIRNGIDHAVGLQAFRSLVNSASEVHGSEVITSPYTRRQVFAGLPLGHDHEHVKVANNSLVRWLSGGKLLGNVHLWFAVIAQIALEKEYLAADPAINSHFEAQLKYRLMNHKTFLGLSGLPQQPLIKVPVALAVYYCVVAGVLYPTLTDRERLRAFIGPPGAALVRLVKKILGWTIPFDVERRQAHLWTLNYCMNRKDELNQLKLQLRAQVQNHLYLKDVNRIILLDGPAQTTDDLPPLPAALSSLPIEEVAAIFSYVNPSKKFGAVVLPMDPSINNAGADLLVVKNNYSDEENDSSMARMGTPICPNTLRPFLKPTGVAWEVVSEQTFGPLHKQISLYRYYLRYIEDKGKFPELDKSDFICYLADREAHRLSHPKDTLPATIIQAVDNVVSNYQQAFSAIKQIVPSWELSETAVLDLTKRSQTKAMREAMENLSIKDALSYNLSASEQKKNYDFYFD